MYEDILYLPHHTSPSRPPMPMSDRAAQFSPFAALTGYEAAVKEASRLTEQRIELDENDDEALQRTIAKAKRLYATFDQPKRNQKIQTYCVRKGFNISAIKEVLEGESE